MLTSEAGCVGSSLVRRTNWHSHEVNITLPTIMAVINAFLLPNCNFKFLFPNSLRKVVISGKILTNASAFCLSIVSYRKLV